MKTPQEYTDNLKNSIITDEMLESALFSVNKRAKNWRDKKREYKQLRYDKYHNYEKAESAENNMYAKKEKLLSLLTPICIHKEFAGYSRTRIYDYESDYDKLLFDSLMRGLVVWENYYVKRGHYDYDDFDDYYEPENVVYFFDRIDYSCPEYRYYLYYVLGGHSFHTPISESDLKKYNYPVVEINELDTSGEEIIELCSVQFVDKLIALINTKEYNFVHTDPEGIEKRLIPEEHIRQANAVGTNVRCEWKRIVKMVSPKLLPVICNSSVEYMLNLDDQKEIAEYCAKQVDRAYKRAEKNKNQKNIDKTLKPKENAFLPEKIDIEYSDELYNAIINQSGAGLITYNTFIEGMRVAGVLDQKIQESSRGIAMNKFYLKKWKGIATEAKRDILKLS